jgi:hypothetical protein
MDLLCCVGKAAVRSSPRVLAGLVPFGEAAYEIVKDVCRYYRWSGERQHKVVVVEPAAAPQKDAKSGELDLALISYLEPRPQPLSGKVLMDNERRTLLRLVAAVGDSTYRNYLPTLRTVDGAAERVGVPSHEPWLYTLEQVHDRHPALDGRHLAWIFNRLLTVLGFCHRQGYVHGAILPCHVLIDPADHGLRLSGWGASVATGQRIDRLVEDYREWYPPEVAAKRPVSAATDLFLATRCMIYLAGGDPVRDRMPEAVPAPMQRFFQTCLLTGAAMRPDDAWKLMDEFQDLLRRLYGPPRFHHLSMT